MAKAITIILTAFVLVGLPAVSIAQSFCGPMKCIWRFEHGQYVRYCYPVNCR